MPVMPSDRAGILSQAPARRRRFADAPPSEPPDIGALTHQPEREAVSEQVLTEIRDLLAEIRELLRPVADAHQDEYARREAEREEQRVEAITALISTDKRKKAWALADGSRA